MIFFFLFLVLAILRDELYTLYFYVGNAKLYVFDVVLLIALFLSIFVRRPRLSQLERTYLRRYYVYVALILAFAGYSLFLGNSVTDVLGRTRVYTMSSIGFIVAYLSVTKRRDLEMALRLIKFAVFVILCVVFYRLYTGVGYREDIFGAGTGVDFIQRFLSLLEAGILLIFYNYLLIKVRRTGRLSVVEWLYIIGMAYAFFVSNYRDVWLAVVIVTAINILQFLLSNQKISRRISVLVFGLVVLAVGYYVVTTFYAQVLYAKLYSSNLVEAREQRLYVWSLGLSSLQGYWFLGRGIGFHQYTLSAYSTLHNDIVQLLRDLGIIGFSLYWLSLSSLFRVPGKQVQDRHDKLDIFASSGVYTFSCFVMLGFFEPFFTQLLSMSLAFMVLGIQLKIRVLETQPIQQAV